MLWKTLVRAAATALTLMTCLPATAIACSRSSIAGADSMIGGAGRIDAALLDRAILVELNFQRCQNGLGELQASPNLRSVALNHAKWMAKTSRVSHKSGIAGQSTLSARMESSGVRFNTGSENIGMVHRFRVDGQSFRINNAASCQFSTNGGQPISAHSYASLARYAVGLWMASSGHRHNILDPRVSMVGSAAAVKSDAQYCGQVFLSQNFAG